MNMSFYSTLINLWKRIYFYPKSTIDWQFERDKVIPWEYLYDHDKETKYNMANRRQEVDIFKLILEKLSSNDFERPIRSCSLSNEDVHKQVRTRIISSTNPCVIFFFLFLFILLLDYKI